MMKMNDCTRCSKPDYAVKWFDDVIDNDNFDDDDDNVIDNDENVQDGGADNDDNDENVQEGGRRSAPVNPLLLAQLALRCYR